MRRPPSSAAGVRGYERIGAAARVCVRLRHSPEPVRTPGDGAVVHNRAEDVPNVTDEYARDFQHYRAVMSKRRRGHRFVRETSRVKH